MSLRSEAASDTRVSCPVMAGSNDAISRAYVWDFAGGIVESLSVVGTALALAAASNGASLLASDVTLASALADAKFAKFCSVSYGFSSPFADGVSGPSTCGLSSPFADEVSSIWRIFELRSSHPSATSKPRNARAYDVAALNVARSALPCIDARLRVAEMFQQGTAVSAKALRSIHSTEHPLWDRRVLSSNPNRPCDDQLPRAKDAQNVTRPPHPDRSR